MKVELGQPFGELGTVMQIDVDEDTGGIFVTVEGSDGYLTKVDVSTFFNNEGVK